MQISLMRNGAARGGCTQLARGVASWAALPLWCGSFSREGLRMRTTSHCSVLLQDCHMEAHADYDGPALTWGLTYKKASAAQCCQACKEVRGWL